MKIAVFTRGTDRDFEWKSEGKFLNRESDGTTRQKLCSYGIPKQLTMDAPGAVISRSGDRFAVLLTGLPTEHKRPVGGFVSAGFALFDLNEITARKLATSVLGNWQHAVDQLVPLIIRHNPLPANPEWSFHADRIRDFVESAQSESVSPDVDDCRSRSYETPEGDAFGRIADLVAHQNFSEADGIKMIVSKTYFDDLEAELPSADILVLPELPNLDTPKKKSLRPKGSPKTTSAQPSNPSTSPKSSGNSLSSVDPTSDKTSGYHKRSTLDLPTPLSRICASRRSKLVIAGFALLVIVGTVTAVSYVANCENKKKDLEHPDQKSQKSEPGAKKEEAGPGSNNPVISADKIETSPATNEKTSNTSEEDEQTPQEPEPDKP